MSFSREWSVKAVRKVHRCDCCGKPIEMGQAAIRWSGMTDGDFGSAIMHPDCRAAEIAMNELKDYRLGDDWWPLREIESDDHEWLAEEYPVVAARMDIELPAPPSEVGHG